MSKVTDLNPGERSRRRTTVYGILLLIVALCATIGLALFYALQIGLDAVAPVILLLVVSLVGWLLGLYLIWRNSFEWGVQLGLIVFAIVMPLTSVVIAERGLLFGIAAAASIVFLATVALPPARAQWFVVAAIFVGLLTIGLDAFALFPRHIFPFGTTVNGSILLAILMIGLGLLLARNFALYPLRIKLLLGFVIVAILSVGAVTYVSTVSIRNSLTENSARDLRTRAQSAALSIGLTMDRNVDRLQTMSLDKRLQDDAAQITDSYPATVEERSELVARNAERWATGNLQDGVVRSAMEGQLAYSLRQFGDIFQGNKELFMTDAYGAVIAATDLNPSYDFSNEQWWKIAYNNGRGSVYIGQPEFDPMIQDNGVRIALPIYAPGHQRAVGVIHAIYTLAALQRALLLNGFGESGKIDLLFPLGQILTSDGTFRALTADEFAEIQDGFSKPLATLNYRGTELLSSQGVIGVSDEQPPSYLRSSAWRTIATVQSDEVLGAAEEGAKAALIASIATIALAVLVALFLAQILTRPIRRLTAVAEEIQGGNLGARATVETGDEIGVLAQTFNGMTARLQDTLAGLERRVAERTEGLVEANLTLQANSSYLSALSDTSTGLFERLNLNELLQAIVERAGALAGTQNGFVFFGEPGDNEIQMRVGLGLYDDMVGTRAQRGVGLAGTVWQSGQPLSIEDYRKWEGRLPGTRRDALRAIVAVPLMRGTGNASAADEIVGVIGLAYTDEEKKFSRTAIETLQRFAQLASIALDNAQLYANSESRIQELGALNSISLIITQESELEPLIKKIGDQVCQIFGTDFAFIALLDPQTELIEFPYVIDNGKQVVMDPLKLGEGLTSQVIMTRQPMLLTDTNQADYRRMGAVNSGDGTSPASLLNVPLLAGDRVLGAMSVQRTGVTRNFSADDQRLLTTIAASVGVGIENTRLAQATRRQLAELAALNKISAILTSDEVLIARLSAVGRELHAIFGVSSVYIALYDAASNLIRMPFFMGDKQEYVVEPFAPGPGFTSHIINTRQPLMINDDMAAQKQALQAIEVGDDTMSESYLGAPILLGEQVLGVIGLSDMPKNRFQESDMGLLNTIGSAVASAIQNTRLLEQTQEHARELDAVNSLAREITQQHSLDDLFQEVYFQVKSVTAADGLLISLYDARTDALTAPFFMDEGRRYESTPEALAREREFADQVRLGESVVVNRTPKEVAELESSGAVAGSGKVSRSRLYIPLMAGVRFLGMISLHSYEYNAYTERDVGVMTGLASHIAIALENARLFEQTQAALAETDRLYRIAEAANVETEGPAFYKRVHEIVGEALYAKNFLIALYNADDGTIDLPYYVDERDTLPELPMRRVNAGSGITAYVLRHREPLLATKQEIHALAAQSELKLHGGESEAWLGVPMLVGERPIGVVVVQSYEADFRYTENDKQTLVKLSQGIANTVERKRAEDALRQSQTALAETMRLTRLANWEYDILSDKFTFNDQFYSMMRTTAAREGGYYMSSAHYAQRFVHPDDAAVVGSEIGRAIQTTDPNFSAELDHRVIFGDGEPGYVTVQFRIQKDAEGRTVKTMGANLDISGRKRAENELQVVLAETQRLAASARDSAEQVTALNRRLTREGWRDYLDQLNSHLVFEAGSGDEGNGHGTRHDDRNGASGNGDNGNGHEKIRVPIQLRGEVIGEIELEAEDEAVPMSAEDMGLVTHVAENIGLALDNARLFTETQRRVTELNALNNISQAVSTELDLDALLNIIGDQLRTIFDVQSTYIAMYDRETQMISLPYLVSDNQRVYVEPMPFGEGITSHIIRERAPLVLNENTMQELEKLGARQTGNPARSYLGVPILVGEEVTGVISIQSTEREGMFDEANLRLMETIAATVGATIQNAQLYGAMQQEVVTRQRAEEEIKSSLKEKEVLLKEIHHRVKNNLQIITSLLNLQSAQIKDPEASLLFRESQARVRSMALIHEKLYQSKDLARIDFDSYVRDLMVYLFRSYGANTDQIRLHIATNDVLLAIDMAIPCGLIVSELVTNVIKYAFPDGKRGELDIGLEPAGDGHLTLYVKDTGVGFVEGFDWRESDSLGLQLVSTLSSQLHGTIEVDGRNGTSFKLTFPAS